MKNFLILSLSALILHSNFINSAGASSGNSAFHCRPNPHRPSRPLFDADFATQDLAPPTPTPENQPPHDFDDTAASFYGEPSGLTKPLPSPKPAIRPTAAAAMQQAVQQTSDITPSLPVFSHELPSPTSPTLAMQRQRTFSNSNSKPAEDTAPEQSRQHGPLRQHNCASPCSDSNDAPPSLLPANEEASAARQSKSWCVTQ